MDVCVYSLSLSLSLYTYIYIYIHIYVHLEEAEVGVPWGPAAAVCGHEVRDARLRMNRYNNNTNNNNMIKNTNT